MLPLRIAVASLAGATALGFGLFAGCQDDTTDGVGGAQASEIEGVIYEGGMTDEALEALLEAPLKTDVEKTAAFTWPEPDAQISPTEPFEFCWHVGPVAQRSQPKSDSRLGLHFEPSVVEPSAFDVASRSLLGSMLSGVPAAHAHGTPVNGPGYFLVISSESEPYLVRVFTNIFDYKINDPDWEKMKAVKAPMTAKVIWADFETNRVLPEGGPWEGTPVTFSIAAE